MRDRRQGQWLACAAVSVLAGTLCLTLPGAPQEARAHFRDVAAEAGVGFLHESGATAEKFLPETMGGGVVLFDYDNDGWPDILLVNGGSFLDPEAAAGAGHRLYRNNGDLTFTDATTTAGIAVSGYGMGACAADYDNDGWQDLYVTSVGLNRLYRNDGSGGFVDVTRESGTGYSLWSASCAFGDIDNDGDLDLYVTNYTDFSVENNKYCGDLDDVRVYCSPIVYNPLPDILYRNNGDGTFTDVAGQAGISARDGYGLGVVFSDFDGDGWIDIYVANDGQLNFLFHNTGSGVFEERGLQSGVAAGSDGQPQAGMGTDMADINGDGLPDVIVTNLDREAHTLYANLGRGLFADVTFESGVGGATLPFVGFGTAFFDYDNDSDLDLVIANGGIFDNAGRFRDTTTHEQRNLLLENDGEGNFADAGPVSGAAFALEKVSRGLAVGDLDNDGDPDIVIANNGQTADLLRNDLPNRGNALLIRTVGTRSNRDGIGARVKLWAGDETVIVREVKAGSSYLGQNDLRVHFGLGRASRAERIEVSWPGGAIDVLENVDANFVLTVVEGAGITNRTPLGRSR